MLYRLITVKTWALVSLRDIWVHTIAPQSYTHSCNIQIVFLLGFLSWFVLGFFICECAEMSVAISSVQRKQPNGFFSISAEIQHYDSSSTWYRKHIWLAGVQFHSQGGCKFQTVKSKINVPAVGNLTFSSNIAVNPGGWKTEACSWEHEATSDHQSCNCM